jgi:uncharacterized protein
MRDFVLFAARALADHPETMRVTEVAGQQTSIIEIHCDQKDIGRLIGRSGKTIGALRTLASNVASRHGRRCVLEVAE